MVVIEFIYIHLLPTLGFVLALVLLAHILRQRRSPTSTLAWLMAVVFIPYIGVPLYIFFGGRKMTRQAASKRLLPDTTPVTSTDTGLEQQLASLVYRGGFPPTRRNRARLLLSGEDAYRATIRLIDRAEHAIYVATYLLGRDETGRAIVKALARRAAQGVRVYLLLDALGSVKVDRRFLAPLEAAGGRVAYFMPMLRLPLRGRANLRNHRKMVIADGRVAIVGGMNLAGEYMGPEARPDRWQDISVRLMGPAAGQAFEIFRSDWQFAAQEDLGPEKPHGGSPDAQEDLGPEKPHGGSPDAAAATALQFMASGPDVENDALREAFMISLFRAHRRVWIVTPYFVPDDLLQESLCMAARRGIDLRLICPRRSNHRLADLAREGYLSQLQEAGARVMLYRPRMLHAKAVLIDDTVAVAGSANMDIRSLLLNYEVGLCVYDTEIIGEIERWMRGLMQACQGREPHRHAAVTLVEDMARLFAPLL
jgi:cardiolipin synthase